MTHLKKPVLYRCQIFFDHLQGCSGVERWQVVLAKADRPIPGAQVVLATKISMMLVNSLYKWDKQMDNHLE